MDGYSIEYIKTFKPNIIWRSEFGQTQHLYKLLSQKLISMCEKEITEIIS